MNINIPQTYFSKLMRAVVEFEMIEQGDRILIGVSASFSPTRSPSCANVSKGILPSQLLPSIHSSTPPLIRIRLRHSAKVSMSPMRS